MKKKAIYLAIPLVLGLTACGGGGGGTTTTSSGLVSVMVTDAVSTQYTKVWVTLKTVTVKDSAGTVRTLFDDPAGRTFNLTELNGVSSLLDLASLAAGTYTDLTITLDPTVILNDGSGSPTQATLASTLIVVPGSFTVTAGQTSIGIDFDLANFSYDASTGIVTPTIVLRDHTTMQRMAQAYAELEGTVKSVSNADEFVMTTARGTDVTVTLIAGNTTILTRGRSGNRQVGFDASQLQPGQAIEVYGNYDAANLTIDAVSIRAAHSSQDAQGVYGRDHVEGLATLAGNLLTIDVREASFVPPDGNEIKIDLTANPSLFYEKGVPDDLRKNATSPVDVELRGNWDDQTQPPVFTPLAINIEGAEPNPSGNGNNATTTTQFADRFIEVKGQLTQDYDPKTKTMRIDVLASDHVDPSLTLPSQIGVDLGHVWFKRGNSSCLTAKSFVELKGALSQTTDMLAARTIKVESACSFSGERVAAVEPVSGAEMMGQGNNKAGMPAHATLPDIRGRILNVDSSAQTLTLEIIRARGITGVAAGDAIVVDVSQSPRMHHGVAADLLATTPSSQPAIPLIEVHAAQADWTAATSGSGTTTAGTLIARRIEII